MFFNGKFNGYRKLQIETLKEETKWIGFEEREFEKRGESISKTFLAFWNNEIRTQEKNSQFLPNTPQKNFLCVAILVDEFRLFS